jgi:hypothetical protein
LLDAAWQSVELPLVQQHKWLCYCCVFQLLVLYLCILKKGQSLYQCMYDTAADMTSEATIDAERCV